MTTADILWTLAIIGGVCAVPVVIDEVFPRFWPWFFEAMESIGRLARKRLFNRRARNRHPIIKDWK